VDKVVFASTGGAVYGEQREFPATEEHPQYPISPYGVSKLAAERYLHFYEVAYGVSYAALRYANVYGPRQDPHGEAGVVAIFCGNLAEDRPRRSTAPASRPATTCLWGTWPGRTCWPWRTRSPSGAYNVGTGIETSVNELYDRMCQLSGRNLLPPARVPTSRRAEAELRGPLKGSQSFDLVA
jgi:UDP-glucose 4-epimerase